MLLSSHLKLCYELLNNNALITFWFIAEKYEFDALRRLARLQNIEANPDSSRRNIETKIILSNTTPRKHENIEAKITALTTINANITTSIDTLRMSHTPTIVTIQAAIATIIINIDRIPLGDIGSDDTPHRSSIGTSLHAIYSRSGLLANNREDRWSIRPVRSSTTPACVSSLSPLAAPLVPSLQSSVNIGLIDLASNFALVWTRFVQPNRHGLMRHQEL